MGHQSQHPKAAADYHQSIGEPSTVNTYEAVYPDVRTVRMQTMAVGDETGKTDGMLPTAAGAVDPDFGVASEVNKVPYGGPFAPVLRAPGDADAPPSASPNAQTAGWTEHSPQGTVYRAQDYGSAWMNNTTGGFDNNMAAPRHRALSRGQFGG